VETGGRDVALWLGRYGGMKLREVGGKAGIDYGGVSLALRRLEQRRGEDRPLSGRLREAEPVLLNVET
jgi:hypothetical protein